MKHGNQIGASGLSRRNNTGDQRHRGHQRPGDRKEDRIMGRRPIPSFPQPVKSCSVSKPKRLNGARAESSSFRTGSSRLPFRGGRSSKLLLFASRLNWRHTLHARILSPFHQCGSSLTSMGSHATYFFAGSAPRSNGAAGARISSGAAASAGSKWPDAPWHAEVSRPRAL
jgi:hypothetical protein